MPNEPPTDADFTQAGLVAATPQEIADALAYALRFDDRGKPRRNGWDFVASLAAERLTEHLQRAGFVVLRSQPGRLPHTVG
jgi:hypothetical protein